MSVLRTSVDKNDLGRSGLAPGQRTDRATFVKFDMAADDRWDGYIQSELGDVLVEQPEFVVVGCRAGNIAHLSDASPAGPAGQPPVSFPLPTVEVVAGEVVVVGAGACVVAGGVVVGTGACVVSGVVSATVVVVSGTVLVVVEVDT